MNSVVNGCDVARNRQKSEKLKKEVEQFYEQKLYGMANKLLNNDVKKKRHEKIKKESLEF